MSKKIVTGVVIGAILLVALAGGWLFMSNQVRLVWGNTTNNGTAVVCGTDVVNTYNTAAYYIKRDNSDTPTLDEAGLAKLGTDIKAKKNYDTDATCQTILFWLAIHDKNGPAADTAYQAVNKLHTKGIFADSNIRSNQPLFTYESYVKALTAGESEGN